VENIVRSLLKQLLCSLTLIPPEIESLYDDCCSKCKPPNTSDLTHRLHQVAVASCKFSSVFFMLDALDECNIHDEVIALISPFGKLGIKVFCTSRHHLTDLPNKLDTTAVLEVRAHDDDVRNYLVARLKEEWKFGDHFKPRVVDRLVNDVDGKSVTL
jgi:hypothetical protein